MARTAPGSAGTLRKSLVAVTLGSVGRDVGNRKTPGPEHLREDDMAKKKKRGRPRELIMPDLIPDTPENIAKACMQSPPKEQWDYLSRWTDNPFGPVDKTPEERERIAKRDAEMEETRGQIAREQQDREQT